MIKSHLLYQLSYRGEAGQDCTAFVTSFHFAQSFFSAGKTESESRVKWSNGESCSRSDDRLCRLLLRVTAGVGDQWPNCSVATHDVCWRKYHGIQSTDTSLAGGSGSRRGFR